MGMIYVVGGNEWFGFLVWKLIDFGEIWLCLGNGFNYVEGEELVKFVWSFVKFYGWLYVGVELVGFFVSGDDGEYFEYVELFCVYFLCEIWVLGVGGLIFYFIVLYLDDFDEFWVVILIVGVFYMIDGGKMFDVCNKGMCVGFMLEGM